MDSLIRQNDQLRPTVRWRTTDLLTDIGKVSNWWRYGWRPGLTFGEAISSGEMSILDLQHVEVLPYISSPLLEMPR